METTEGIAVPVATLVTPDELQQEQKQQGSSEAESKQSAFHKGGYGSKDEISQLIDAIDAGMLDRVRAMIAEGVPIQVAESNPGRFALTALHQAAWHGHDEICRFLLTECGVAIDPQDRAGLTPLHRAAYNGKTQCCAMLVESGANLWIVDDDGYTPMQLAERHGQTSCAKWLLEQSTRKAVAQGIPRALLEHRSAIFEGSLESPRKQRLESLQGPLKRLRTPEAP